MTDRRRRQKAARAIKRQAEKKRRGRRELGRRLATALGFGLLVVGVLTFSSLFDDDGELPVGYERYRSQPTACGAEQPPPEQVLNFEAPERQGDLESVVTVTINTSCGEIVIELDPTGYPDTVNSFVFLAREGFYDGQAFHRVLADWVIQGGDPSGDGTGGPGYVIPDEFPPEDYVYVDGTVAMANAGKGTTGSQFFIVLGDSAQKLSPRFNVLGNVISGKETLAVISEVEVAIKPGGGEKSRPLETIYINSVSIESSS